MQGSNSFDPLWVPVLTHYDESGSRLDQRRTAAQLRQITPYVTQYLLAGTTGDGWGMSDSILEDWIALAQAPGLLDQRHKLLFGAFGATTEEVIARARKIEAAITKKPLAAGYAGLTICAQVEESASQAAIAAHFEEILAATSSPLAVYQLPQITQCEIAPETLSRLAEANPRITLIKDTSGGDRVAESDLPMGAARLLRGAEGDYSGQLKPAGPYDGWLLSTANGFAPQLRQIAELVARGETEEAQKASSKLTELVAALFTLAQGLPEGNPFSNANRAVDHLFACGEAWTQQPLPRLTGGATWPKDFLLKVQNLLSNAGYALESGYIAETA